MKSVRTLTVCVILLLSGFAEGWSQSAPARAFDNVTIHTADGETIENGTVVWRDGVIEVIGDDVTIPFDAYVIDGGDSLHIYPGFLDGLALWGSPDLPDRYEEPERPGDPGYKRAGIQPQRSPGEVLKTDDKNLAKARKYGFVTAALGLKGQMLPGQVDLFFLKGEQTDENRFKEGIGLHAQFEGAPGGFGSGAYPSTLMGIMAQYRQLWYDATALRTQMEYFASTDSDYPAPKSDKVLESFFPVMDQEQPLYFVVDSKENIERLFWLKDELGFDVVLVSGEEAHAKAEELNERDIPVLASIDLPDEPEWRAEQEKKAKSDTVEEQEQPEEISEEQKQFRERQLQAYMDAVENIKSLLDAGVKVGYASNGLKLGDIAKHLRTLLEDGGLSEQQILGMFTQHTADILGIGNRLGDLQDGRIASFSVYTKPLTDKKSQVMYSVSEGDLEKFEIEKSSKGKGNGS